MRSWLQLIREVPDFPSVGSAFRDISPFFSDARGFAACVDAMAAPWRGKGLDAVLGVESRGFILGAALARALDVGFVTIRKPGKLPGQTLSVDYALEYGSDRLQMQVDALAPASRVIVVDDVLATGGTLHAAVGLARRQGAQVVGAAVLVELEALGARRRWTDPVPLSAAALL